MITDKLKNNLIIALSLMIFASIVVVAFHYRYELLKTFQRTDKLWLIAGLGCYFANYVSRAFRIKSYSSIRLKLYPETLRITCLHGFASYFLPIRTGDLTLPAFLNLYNGIPLIEGGRILFRARLLDTLSLGILLTAATLFSAPQLDLLTRLLFFCLGLIFIGLPYSLIALIRWKKKWIFEKFKMLKNISGDFTNFPLAKELVQSLLIWFWTGCTTFCVIRSLNISLSFLDVWFFAAIQLPLQLLPVQGLANSGNHEAGWFLTLKLLGINKVDAVTVTLTSHIILITYVLFLGLIAVFLPNRRPISRRS